MRLVIERLTDNETQTIGTMFVLDASDFTEWDCHCLEPAWKDNQQNISCIPEGIYRVEKHYSPAFKQSFWVKDVPGRSEILIHKGNFRKDTRGCIIPGIDMKDINGDKNIDVVSSKAAIHKLYDLLPSTFELEIINGYNIDHDL